MRAMYIWNMNQFISSVNLSSVQVKWSKVIHMMLYCEKLLTSLRANCAISKTWIGLCKSSNVPNAYKAFIVNKYCIEHLS